MALRPRHLLLPGLGFSAGVLAVLLSGHDQAPAPAPTTATVLAPTSYATAIATAAPSVVQVLALRPDGATPGGVSQGSGVIIDADGLILTNAHVLAGASQVIVVLADRRRLPARVLGSDPAMDLTLLAVDATGLTAAAPGDPRHLAPGDVVLTLGHPWGLGQTAGVGIVGATRRRAVELGLGAGLVPAPGPAPSMPPEQVPTPGAELIQTDAAINPGSSGGALLDTDGRLLGISTAAISGSGQAEGVGLVIPADAALAVAGRLAAAAGRPRGWLGVKGATLNPALSRRFGLRAPHGVFIVAVAPDTPAATAGLRAGDVISAIDGTPLTATAALGRRLADATSGPRLALEVWRGGKRMHMVATATLIQPPAADTAPADSGPRLARPRYNCIAAAGLGC